MRDLDTDRETKRIVGHALLPAIFPVAFFVIAAIPVEAIGCRNRGLIAFFLALTSGIGSLTSITVALRGRLRKNEKANWWVLTALILVVPVVALIVLA